EPPLTNRAHERARSHRRHHGLEGGGLTPKPSEPGLGGLVDDWLGCRTTPSPDPGELAAGPLGPKRPCVPITIRSMSLRWAYSTMCRPTRPNAISVTTASPGSSSAATARSAPGAGVGSVTGGTTWSTCTRAEVAGERGGALAGEPGRTREVGREENIADKRRLGHGSLLMGYRRLARGCEAARGRQNIRAPLPQAQCRLGRRQACERSLTIRTGHRAYWRTRSETDPSRSRLMPPSPRAPTTTRSASWAAAAATITS